jgi:hypothetical protein
VTMPTLAHISWMEAISGKVMRAVHNVEKPKPAPACE